MINRIQYTPEVLQETQAAAFKKKIGNRFYAIYFLAAIMAAFFIYYISSASHGPKDFTTWIFLVLGIALSLETYVMRKLQDKRMVKVNRKKFEEMYGNDRPVMVTEISDDGLVVHTGSSEKHIAYKDVKEFIETKNLIVLYMKNEMVMPLSKDGFEDGTVEDCIEIFQTNIKHYHNNQKHRDK